MIHLSIGRRGQGKTTLAYRWARTFERRLVFDPRGMIKRGTAVGSREDLDLAFVEFLDGDRTELVYVPAGDVRDEFIVFAWYVAEFIRERPRWRLAIMVDEAGFLGPAQETPAFMWACRCCDRDRVDIWMTAHRPKDISTNIRAIADTWRVFPCRQEHDLAVIGERCGDGVAGDVAQLQDRRFIEWDDAKAIATARVDPAEWFIDLRAP